ncbi:hypothetical protein BGX27_000934 [Mortierella sp. AM989]|nr:hypothetical protein BGX27_000934 [Mortierella sp. AM989]
MSAPAPSDISSIVPGSIFQDDIQPPSITDGSSGFNDQQPQSISQNGSVSGERPQIEVNSTIQTILISLGIIVAILFLGGVVATYYISYKNKKAEKAKKKLEGAVDLEKGSNVGDHSEIDIIAEKDIIAKNGFGRSGSHAGSQENSRDGDKESSSSEAGYSRPSTPGMEFAFPHNNGSGVNPFSTPTRSLLGGSSLQVTATGTTGSAGDSCHHSNRNSIVDVTSVYTRRQSMIDSLGAPPSGYQDYQTGSQQYYQDQQLPSSYMGPTSSGAGSVLLDPFKTNNNSTASLDLLIRQQKTTAREEFTSHNRNPSSESLPGASTTPKDWQNCSDQYYSGDVQQIPVSAPIVMMSNSSAVDGDISYQPPSQPTSLIHTKLSYAVTSPRTAFRNGAAVFEGVTVPRTARPSLDESEAGNVIISLPSPRGCLLEAATAGGEGEGEQEFIVDQQEMDGAYLEYGLHPQQQDSPSNHYPKVVRREPKQHSDQGNGMVRSSYLDDYREQQQLQKQQQQESSGFGGAGKRLSTKFLKRISMYSSSPVDSGGSNKTANAEDRKLRE